MSQLKTDRRCRGLTLIELLTALAIVGILAAVAWPAFEGQLQKNKRREAINALMRASQEMHQCRTDGGDYTGCTLSFANSKEGNYAINRSVTGSGAGFTITASRIVGDDPECTAFTIDNLGRKGHTGSATTDNACWGE
jgi:type IV pilus assembly protein PilE